MFGGGKKVVGLDVGSHQVKAIELRKSGSKVELVRAGIAEVFPGGDITAAQDQDYTQLRVKAIQKALDNGGISARYSVSAVSGESIIVRYIQLPEMPEAELKNALRWEAEEYIPFSIDEVNLDSVVLGPSSIQGKLDVLLVSARKDLVNEHVQLVRSAGLTPLIVDVEGFAFVNCFEMNYEPGSDDCVCLVHIGAEVTNINIYVGNTSRFSRDVGLAGNAISETVAQKCNTTFLKAEEMKKSVGAESVFDEEEQEGEGDSELISTIRGAVERITGSDLGDDTPEATAARAIQGSLQQLVSEIRRSIQFFEGQSGGAVVQRVIVGGGSSRLRNLPQFLQKEIDISVEIMDPLRNITIGRDVDQSVLENHREQFAPGIGLALRKVLD